MGVGMAAVAAAGWLDDRKGLPAGLRLCVHFAAAAWVVWWLGGLHLVKFGAASVTLGPFGTIVAVVAIVWMTNLYNFMDGIDGIAASEAVVTGLVGGTLLLMSNSIGLGLLALLTAGAAAGFLLLNWPPARIFMGDVGSGSLGFLFASIALDSEHHGGVPFVLWLILLSLFIGDATITLVRRFVAGERIGEAHKSHAYQRALLNARGHSDVLVAVCTINAVLAMLTICAWQAPSFTLAAVGVAAFVVILFYLLVESKAPFGKTSSGKS
jgi:Fuc2NAc and GlcNAc transferase